MHARGLLNSQAIQYNMDWIWPYWVNRQFDPEDNSFVPRAFSLTHINLTHRNWTSVGRPGTDDLVLVDPAGLVTPLRDGWSLDFWVNDLDSSPRSPAESQSMEQTLRLDGAPEVITSVDFPRQSVNSTVRVEAESVCRNVDPVSLRCVVETRIRSDVEGWFTVALRPYNPEGVSTVNTVRSLPDRTGWMVLDEDRQTDVLFNPIPDRMVFSNYENGDVSNKFPDPETSEGNECSLGMANAGAVYRLEAGQEMTVRTLIPLGKNSSPGQSVSIHSNNMESWEGVLQGSCRLEVPDDRIQFLFESSKRTLITLSGEEIYPGSFTYKRFWFRDATYMLDALLALGYKDRVRRVLESYPERQQRNGYFCSQKGEWDSNGQVLWILRRFRRVSGERLPGNFKESIRSGAEWIRKKRLSRDLDEPHAGLLPAGFSAEHFGPNDYYFWDDFWSIAGLRAAADLLVNSADCYREEARSLLSSVERSLEFAPDGREDQAMPPSPYRSVDAGSVGNMVAGYPLRIYSAEDSRLIDTAEALREQHFVDGAFFQEMIHSGMNPYLSLHIAQVYLRAHRREFWPIVRSVAKLASPTGKWPEAVHPETGGGCMGDGEHGWAAADWILMIRNLFVREEGEQRLILGSGLPEEWLSPGTSLSLGPTGTRFGPVTVELSVGEEAIEISFESDPAYPTPEVEMKLVGYQNEFKQGNKFQTKLTRLNSH